MYKKGLRRFLECRQAQHGALPASEKALEAGGGGSIDSISGSGIMAVLPHLVSSPTSHNSSFNHCKSQAAYGWVYPKMTFALC